MWVIERIADGLGVPRAWLGVSYVEEPEKAPSAKEAPPAAEEVDENVKRRSLITFTLTVAVNRERPDLPELVLPPDETDETLPPQLEISHVHIVRAVTDQLASLTRYYGGQGGLWTGAAKSYTRWMKAPGPEAVKRQLAAALSVLHTGAGRCRYDSGMDGTGHYARALSLAQDAKDSFGIANAAWSAGATMVRRHPNDALKLCQLGQIHLAGFRWGGPASRLEEDPRLPTLTAWLNLTSATAYAVLHGSDEAKRYLAQAQEGWEPSDACDRGHMERATAGIWLDLGQLDAAEASASTALRTYGDNHRLGRIMTELLLAEVYLRAGEPQGLALAHHAIEKVSTLHSLTARRDQLIPLATALEARPSTDRRDLARKARQITTTRI